MSDLLSSLKELKKVNKFFSGLKELAEKLEDIGSLEQAAKEAKNRCDEFRKLEAKASADLEKAAAHLGEAQVECDNILAQARRDAKSIIERAQKEADELSGSAQRSHSENIDKLERQRDVLLFEIDDLLTKQAEAERDLKEVEARREIARQRIEELKQSL